MTEVFKNCNILFRAKEKTYINGETTYVPEWEKSVLKKLIFQS